MPFNVSISSLVIVALLLVVWTAGREPRFARGGVRKRQLVDKMTVANTTDEEDTGDELVIQNATTMSPIEATAKDHSDWCPSAVCENSIICKPCDRRYLIILATGRSASTTLTWMMDSLPGIRMGGENKDIISDMEHMFDDLRTDKAFVEGANVKDPWGHNQVYPGSYACAGQSIMEVINPPEDEATKEADLIVGFKIITLQFFKQKQLKPYLDFLHEIFPCARFLVNIRSDVESQAQSVEKTFTKVNSDNEVADLQDANQRYRKIAKDLGEDAFLLDSTEWTQNITVLNNAVDWLGFHKSCHFKTLLEFNTEGWGYANGKTELESIDPECRYIGSNR